MQAKIDSDVMAVVEFMERTIPPAKLMGVAKGVTGMAGFLWDHYDPQDVERMRLVRATDPRALNNPLHSETGPRAANGQGRHSAGADDDSAVGAVDP
jgi:hypothetical protein